MIALGADYDMDATPGLAEGGNEFYSVAGAERLGGIIPTFSQGHAIIGVCGAPFKCPPAPSECALLLDDELTARGVRDACQISFVMPLGTPVPPSPETSAALVKEFAERDITLISGRRVSALDPTRSRAILDDGSELPFDLFLGVPKHRAPEVVIASGMTEDGYVPVDSATLATRFPGVYAVGDVATAGVPKAGMFAEGAARVVAQTLIASCKEASGRARTSGAARATSSSARDGSAAWTSTSCPAPREREASTRRPPPWSLRRSASVPAAAPAGSVADHGHAAPSRRDARRARLGRTPIQAARPSG